MSWPPTSRSRGMDEFNLRSYAMIYGGSDTSAFLAQQLALPLVHLDPNDKESR